MQGVAGNMSSYRFNECVDDGLRNMIVVTGIYRSGTTITGKVIGSFKDIEYAYDPPLLFYLAYLQHLGRIKDSELLNLVRVYLYYDYYLNYLHGRYNFRVKDEGSCILHMKPCKEVLEKLFAVDNIKNANSKNTRFAFKFCNLYDLIMPMVREYSKIKVIDLKRDLKQVFSSMLVKKWFFQDSLSTDSAVLWPFFNNTQRGKVPYIVTESDIDFWLKSNDITKSAYACCRFAEKKIKLNEEISKLENTKEIYFELIYEDLVRDPSKTVKRISEFTGSQFGALTQQIVNDIRSTESRFDVDEMIKECDPKVKERFYQLNAILGY